MKDSKNNGYLFFIGKLEAANWLNKIVKDNVATPAIFQAKPSQAPSRAGDQSPTCRKLIVALDSGFTCHAGSRRWEDKRQYPKPCDSKQSGQPLEVDRGSIAMNHTLMPHRLDQIE